MTFPFATIQIDEAVGLDIAVFMNDKFLSATITPSSYQSGKIPCLDLIDINTLLVRISRLILKTCGGGLIG
ncbi:hypothetical protein DBT48_08360 [Aerococcus mictus]|nr:hypothetical protein F6I06_07475 [Aerococcus mictus]PKY82198.1 hypothetical protein CYJ31_06360 [Aerococcus mictus]PMB93211.1 hypothetical protein CK795_06330 [Aerococcus mictus]RAV62381.1 hypothetical protein DBT35_07410 [Aerococcus mictus]RAV70569.1 hypothetical protein DBT47_07145 [Aerococcus mictus]